MVLNIARFPERLNFTTVTADFNIIDMDIMAEETVVTDNAKHDTVTLAATVRKLDALNPKPETRHQMVEMVCRALGWRMRIKHFNPPGVPAANPIIHKT